MLGMIVAIFVDWVCLCSGAESNVGPLTHKVSGFPEILSLMRGSCPVDHVYTLHFTVASASIELMSYSGRIFHSPRVLIFSSIQAPNLQTNKKGLLRR